MIAVCVCDALAKMLQIGETWQTMRTAKERKMAQGAIVKEQEAARRVKERKKSTEEGERQKLAVRFISQADDTNDQDV